MILHVLTIDHRHGTNATLHTTKEAAKAAVVAYVDEWWDDECDGGRPDNDDEAIDEYFESAKGEFYSITEAVADGPTLNVRISDEEAEILRVHLRDSHPSLFNPVADGPLPEDLESVPAEILAAIHTANHMIPWREHHIDTWIRGVVAP